MTPLGGASTFSSEEIPEFDDEEGNVSAATDGGSTAGTSPIDINNHNNLYNKYIWLISIYWHWY